MWGPLLELAAVAHIVLGKVYGWNSWSVQDSKPCPMTRKLACDVMVPVLDFQGDASIAGYEDHKDSIKFSYNLPS